LTTPAAVTLEGIGKRFGEGTGAVQAVTDIDLTVAAGEFVSLIGPSGCGKSTLLRIVANLIEPSEGAVLVNGKPADRARLDQDYGIAFQSAGLLEWRTVQGNVELPLGLHGGGPLAEALADALERDCRRRRHRASLGVW
jgi:NitT/TauT family transport system ATP-binding protein